MSQAVVSKVRICCMDALGSVEYLASGFQFENQKAVGALLKVAHLALEQVFSLTEHGAVAAKTR